METCIFFAPNKNKRSSCSFNPHSDTIHGRRSIFINIYFSPLFIQANLGDIYILNHVDIFYGIMAFFHSQ